MALNNIFLKFFILNSSYVTVNFQEVMVQLAPRVTVRQTNLGIQLGTLTGQVRIVKYGLMHTAGSDGSTGVASVLNLLSQKIYGIM